MATSTARKPSRKITQRAISRAVASSTAIETGQRIEILERKLKQKSQTAQVVKLAGERKR